MQLRLQMWKVYKERTHGNPVCANTLYVYFTWQINLRSHLFPILFIYYMYSPCFRFQYMTTRKTRSRKQKSRRRQESQRRQDTRRRKPRITGAGDTAAEHAAAQKIQTFVERRTSLFLKKICSDSNVCIAFGIEQPKIYAFFHGYADKKYIQLPIRRIGKPSRNGFVNEIEYQRDGYVSHAILKSSAKRGADNLVYEYIVGQYMNKMSKFYPCIMQTYGLLQYEDADSYHMMQMSEDSITTPDELEQLKLNRVRVDEITDELLLNACKAPLNYAILAQTIKDAISFTEMRREGNVANIVLALHQVYFTLHCMRDSFTHYDLHMDNVVCYSVGKNKYIEFVYHLNGGKLMRYNYDRLSYMLDYGRSFFYESPERNSLEILNKLCKINCPTTCGSGDGFSYLTGNESVHITGSKRNMSADLRLLKLAFDVSSRRNILFTKTKFDGKYGTPEIVENGFRTGNIYNVSDALIELSAYVRSAGRELTQKYIRDGFTKMGTLHIYEDGITPMKYEPEIAAPVPPVVQPSVSVPKPITAVPSGLIPSLTKKFPTVDTRVSVATNAPYFAEYMNFSPPIKSKRTIAPPPLPTRQKPTIIVNNTVRAPPLVLPPEIDKAFYEAETPK